MRSARFATANWNKNKPKTRTNSSTVIRHHSRSTMASTRKTVVIMLPIVTAPSRGRKT